MQKNILREKVNILEFRGENWQLKSFHIAMMQILQVVGVESFTLIKLLNCYNDTIALDKLFTAARTAGFVPII